MDMLTGLICRKVRSLLSQLCLVQIAYHDSCHVDSRCRICLAAALSSAHHCRGIRRTFLLASSTSDKQYQPFYFAVDHGFIQVLDHTKRASNTARAVWEVRKEAGFGGLKTLTAQDLWMVFVTPKHSVLFQIDDGAYLGGFQASLLVCPFLSLPCLQQLLPQRQML